MGAEAISYVAAEADGRADQCTGHGVPTHTGPQPPDSTWNQGQYRPIQALNPQTPPGTKVRPHPAPQPPDSTWNQGQAPSRPSTPRLHLEPRSG